MFFLRRAIKITDIKLLVKFLSQSTSGITAIFKPLYLSKNYLHPINVNELMINMDGMANIAIFSNRPTTEENKDSFKFHSHFHSNNLYLHPID